MDCNLILKIFVGCITAYGVSKLITWYYSRIRLQKRQEELGLKANKKRTSRDILRRQYNVEMINHLSSNKNRVIPNCDIIPYMSASELVDAIKSKKLKSADIISIFATRCIEAGEELNIVAEELYSTALKKAQIIDTQIEDGTISQETSSISTSPNKSTILLGVPISVKDQIEVEGYDSTCGLASRCFKPATEDAVIVKLLRQAGAIPIVRGNVAQCLMAPESDNLIWGQSQNPWNSKKTPGGSSGGEAALVSARAVPLSIGTDIGGSIRIPAHFCGVYGLKPTPSRISALGCPAAQGSGINGQQIIHGARGPMANCVEDLVLVMRAWLVPEMSRLDPAIPLTGFDYDMYEGNTNTFSTFEARLLRNVSIPTSPIPKVSLKIGYFTYDGYTDVCKTGERAVKIAIDALKSYGYELIPFTPPSMEHVATLYLAILGAEGKMRGFFQGLDGEALHDLYKEVCQIASLPDFVRPILSTVLRLLGESRVSNVVARVYSKSAAEHWNDVIALIAYTRAFTKLWKELELDAVICPGLHVPAVNHSTCSSSLPLFVSTFLWNIVHYPVGAVPVTHVLKEEDDYLSNARIHDRFSRSAQISMKDSVGLPFGVQIACLPNHDELVLRIMKEIQDYRRKEEEKDEKEKEEVEAIETIETIETISELEKGKISTTFIPPFALKVNTIVREEIETGIAKITKILGQE